MRSLIIIFLGVFISSLFLFSCSSQIQKDAKEMASLKCEYRKAIAKASKDAFLSGNLSGNSMLNITQTTKTELRNKIMKKEREILERLRTDAERDEYRKALEDELKTCR